MFQNLFSGVRADRRHVRVRLLPASTCSPSASTRRCTCGRRQRQRVPQRPAVHEQAGRGGLRQLHHPGVGDPELPGLGHDFRTYLVTHSPIPARPCGFSRGSAHSASDRPDRRRRCSAAGVQIVTNMQVTGRLLRVAVVSPRSGCRRPSWTSSPAPGWVNSGRRGPSTVDELVLAVAAAGSRTWCAPGPAGRRGVVAGRAADRRALRLQAQAIPIMYLCISIASWPRHPGPAGRAVRIPALPGVHRHLADLEGHDRLRRPDGARSVLARIPTGSRVPVPTTTRRRCSTELAEYLDFDAGHEWGDSARDRLGSVPATRPTPTPSCSSTRPARTRGARPRQSTACRTLHSPGTSASNRVGMTTIESAVTHGA